ncbi:hypothetical protein [Streptomyces fumanus]
MTFLDWLLWLACLWATFLGYCASSLPDLVQHLAARYRHGSTR